MPKNTAIIATEFIQEAFRKDVTARPTFQLPTISDKNNIISLLFKGMMHGLQC